ncbi:uncharacterized protein Dyak_GE11326 [Drosophila yakuba]|uniref:t-SNARE coiled-coil homology domain-containing protein n=1 Tax=Drosophila yakuba TaxID=7245 RepID=A0A0R1E7Y5_DROYA|nr:uncharacterized protein Dyak_GE11326 [Drosophila yakuba]
MQTTSCSSSETGISSLQLRKLQLPNFNIYCDVSSSRIRPYIPSPMRRITFDVLHGMAHSGKRATVKLVTERFVWPSLMAVTSPHGRCKKTPEFQRRKRSYRLHHIVDDTDKFDLVTLHLEEDVVLAVEDLVTRPPADNKNAAIKTSLLQKFVELPESKLRRLLQGKELSIIRQKSLKSDQELEISYRKAKELEIFIKKFTSKLELLNDKIYKKRIYHDVEESEFDHEQSEQTQKLKITELKILKLEGKIIELQNEIEFYKDFVIDNHRETLSWETKYKMLEETIKWAKKERSVKGEIGLMKTEIHRMNIRYSQLKRAQESLVLDLEHCVMHREQIFVNASVKEHLQTKFKQRKNASQIQVRLDEVHNRTELISNEITFLSEKQLIDDVNKIERMIYMLRRIQTDLNDIIKEDANIQDRIEEGVLAKHANLEQIIRKQMRAKAYKKLNSLKSQQVILRSELTVQQISQKQSELNYNLTEISKALLFLC